MSEFKYACPVCGQHIKCDSSQAGTVMDCPTCFQKIVVPQAPTSEDQKFILTGTKLEDKKTSTLAGADSWRTLPPAKAFPAAAAFLMFLAFCVAAGLYFFRGQLPHIGPGWQTMDVGAVGAPGTFSQKDGTLKIGGSGADIWFQTDAFHYAYRPADGDLLLTARVQTIQNTDPWAKAGLMVRESGAPEAMFAAILVTPSSGVAFQQRTAPGSQATSVLIVPGVQVPQWVRLRRHGDTFTADYSKNGTSWTPAGSTTLAMPKKACAGLVVCSHNRATMCEAAFDQVSIASASAPKAPATANPSSAVKPPPPKPAAPHASDANWTLDLHTNAISDAPVAGRIHGQDFLVERASFQNGSLAIRVGTRGPMELGAIINFGGADAEELSGKTINVTTNAEKAARVSLRWKDDTGEEQKANFDAGYALRLDFGALANNRLPGKLYLCLPDPEKSYLLGSFRAGVSKPKPKAAAPPKQ